MEALLPIAPTTVGDYTLGELLGRGGMSEVYACTHPAHGRAALKLLRDDADGAFHVEAATRDVAHANVVRVLDAGLDAATRRYYLVMERLDGPDLATHLARGPLDERTARALFAQIADGMHAVHAHGIVHRDLKPANVMLHAGAPRIVDFGIAKLLGHNAALVTSRRIGTLGYMAPEQLVGGKIAPSVDVWALGIMLFEAVTTRLPFDGFTESYSPQLVETAPRASSLARVSPAYDALVAACLDPDPARRPPMVYVARALRGEVAVETVLDERVTQDIGAMPAALSRSGASSSGAASSGASSSGAASSGASSSGASSSGASSSGGLLVSRSWSAREDARTGWAHEERAREGEGGEEEETLSVPEKVLPFSPHSPPSRVLAPVLGKRALVWAIASAGVIAIAIAVSLRSSSETSSSAAGVSDGQRAPAAAATPDVPAPIEQPVLEKPIVEEPVVEEPVVEPVVEEPVVEEPVVEEKPAPAPRATKKRKKAAPAVRRETLD